MKYLIVGLGNIGPEYHETRHNIGFMVLDALAKANNIIQGRSLWLYSYPICKRKTNDSVEAFDIYESKW